MKFLNKLKTFVILLLLKLGIKLHLKKKVLGYSLIVKIDNQFEYYSRFRHPYIAEPLMIDWISDFVDKNSIIFDIGANVGNYSILIAKKLEKLNGSGLCYAIEPFFKNYKRLCENIEINNLDRKRIVPLNLALGNKTQISFYSANSNLSGSSGKITNDGHQAVFETTLQNLLKIGNVKIPTHLKIDIDFNTKNIFTNPSFLESESLKNIYIELNINDYSSVKKQLEFFGFREFKQHTYPACDSNYIFLR
tara:strand:+ start:755 stop:1501 length:747 start_codon:yes stop_codon:yes gene_type:complete